MAFLVQGKPDPSPIVSKGMTKRKAKPESFIRNPVYPGGNAALQEFILSNLRYPEEAIRNRVEGSVKVAYDVDVFGKVTDAKVTHGIGYGCDEEALRLVRALQYPKKKYQGLHVVFHLSITIHFRLNPVGNQEQGAAIKLNYVSADQHIPPSPSGSGTTYTYSIRIDPEKN